MIYINASTIKRKINAIRNEKLKLALRLQVSSGLRVFEIAALESRDLVFNNDGSMTVIVRKGKGGKYREVDVKDSWLHGKLKEFIQVKEGKLFYSTESLRLRCREYGIETHDLRRINAQERYNELKKNGLKNRDAKNEIQKQLGHSNRKTTDLYLRKKKVIYE
ncbi:MAG: site-specific integrase [Clostridia bacterium]|nr:site-specific integrase [Clostridia bacterium]